MERAEKGQKAAAGRYWSWVVLAVALGFYLIFTARFPYPNEWAATLVSLLGLDPFRPLSHPVWQILMQVVARMSGAELPVVANYFSALCTAACIWLLYSIVSQLGFERVTNVQRREALEAESAPSRRVAGFVAAAYAMASIPVFVIGTRANPMALDVLMFLGAILLTLRFNATGAIKHWFAFAFLYGFGFSEFPTFILVAPVFAFWWLVLFWRHKMLRWQPIAGGFLLFLIGAAVLFAFCWRYYQSPVAEWREFGSYWIVLKQCLTEQYHLLSRSVPRLGWLVILLLMIAPAFVLFSQGFEEAEDLYTKIGLYFFRAILVLLALVPLFDLPGSPWRLTGESPLIVTPYFVAAMWFGHIVGYWHLSLVRMNTRAGDALRPVMLSVVALVMLAAGGLHIWKADVKQARPVVEYARDIVKSMDGRTWLLTDGVMDPVLHLVARKEGAELHLLNRAAGRSKAYLRYVVTLFDDPALQSVGRAGLQPLIDIWLDKDPDLAGKLAVLEFPDLWKSRGFQYLPNKTLYFGSDRKAVVDRDAMFAVNMEYLKGAGEIFGAGKKEPAIAERYHGWVRGQLGKLANNLGVSMEGAGRTNEAWQAYMQARAMETNNVSALLNLAALAERDARPEQQELQDAINRYVERQRAPPSVWALAAEFGYIHDPRFYATEGWVWALTGKTDAGVRLMQESADRTGDTAVELSLARLLVADKQEEKGIEVYERILERDPKNVAALVNLARVRIMQGDLDGAEHLHERALQSGATPAAIALDRGMLLMSRGNVDEARAVLLAAADHGDAQPPLWLGLAFAAVQAKDKELLARAEDNLRKLNRYVPGLLLLSELELNRGHMDEARAYIEQASRVDPVNIAVLERLVNLDFSQREMAWAFEHASDLLNVDASNHLANYVLGVYYYQEGRMDLAEASLRRSIQSKPSGPALNDLAWILKDKGRNEEALELSIQSLKISPKQPLFWGTLGHIREKLGQKDEAAAAFDRAIYYGLRHPSGLLAAARVFLDVSDKEKAGRIVTYLYTVEDKLTKQQKVDLIALRSLLPAEPAVPKS